MNRENDNQPQGPTSGPIIDIEPQGQTTESAIGICMDE